MKIDLHIHTLYSSDCLTSLDKIIKVCRQKKIEALAVCDHHTLEGAYQLKKIAPPWLKIIVGEEITTPAGEMLAFFIKKCIPKNLSPQEVISQVKKQGGLIGLPHPFDRIRRSKSIGFKKETLRFLINQLDFIEVFNSRTQFQKDNHLAYLTAEKHHLVQTVGSDSHSAGEIGRALLEINDFSHNHFTKKSSLGIFLQPRGKNN